MQSGDTIGPYTLVSRLGRGSFGVVWLAERRTPLSVTKVALKFPHDDVLDLELVKQEAEVWSHASGHPNVLSIIEANVYDERVVIVSEFAPDGSLEDRIRNGQILAVDDSVEIILGILAGLTHLHKRNIIHRDLKPANVLFQGETPRLADFGVSRIAKSTAHSRNSAGTPLYMAPEAFDGERTVQTDVWSVGVLLYQLLAGRLPFAQADFTALIGSIIRNEPEELDATIPSGLRRVVTRALTKDKEQRYREASEMYLDLKALPKFEGLATLRFSEAATIPDVRVPTLPNVEKPPTKAVSNKLGVLYIGLGIILAALIGGGIYFATRNATGSESTNVTTAATPAAPAPVISSQMVDIPGGTFTMGRDAGGRENERPAHAVTVPPFRMDKTEVTNAEYYAFIRETAYRPIPGHWVNEKPGPDEENAPVRYVNIEDIRAFASWRSKRDGVTYRLPTEAEWEFAARNGAKGNLFPWGDTFDSKCAVMNRETAQLDPVSTASCPNEWGVYDLIGNVFEWTDSKASLYPGSGGTLGETRVPHVMIRGGSSFSRADGEFGITSTFRQDIAMTRRDKELGFRLVVPQP